MDPTKEQPAAETPSVAEETLTPLVMSVMGRITIRTQHADDDPRNAQITVGAVERTIEHALEELGYSARVEMTATDR